VSPRSNGLAAGEGFALSGRERVEIADQMAQLQFSVPTASTESQSPWLAR
jgi:hypothetical protein